MSLTAGAGSADHYPLHVRIFLAPPVAWETTVELIARLKLPGHFSSVSRVLGELVKRGILDARPCGSMGRARQYRLSKDQLLIPIPPELQEAESGEQQRSSA